MAWEIAHNNLYQFWIYDVMVETQSVHDSWKNNDYVLRISSMVDHQLVKSVLVFPPDLIRQGIGVVENSTTLKLNHWVWFGTKIITFLELWIFCCHCFILIIWNMPAGWWKNFSSFFESWKVLEKRKTIWTSLLFGLPWTMKRKNQIWWKLF